MHVFLRVVRVLVPVALIAVAVAAVVSVLSARPDLSNARSRVDGAWSQLAPRLDTRYQLLADASTKLSAVQGPVHSVAGGVNTAVVRWRQDRQSHAPVADQVRAANDLEATGRQLVATASASPRVKGDAPAQAALDAYLSDKALSARSWRACSATATSRRSTRPASDRFCTSAVRRRNRRNGRCLTPSLPC